MLLSQRLESLVFPLCLGLGASLLFTIQPIVAKILLPQYGGSPAVWTACMVFFQILLLISYSYVWLLPKIGTFVDWRRFHGVILIINLAIIPLKFIPKIIQLHPWFNILYDLTIQLALPIFLIGTSAPLLQHIFSQTKNRGAHDPYFLYVASNAGSLIALLSYPFLLERLWGVKDQLYFWNKAYFIYLFILGWILYNYRVSLPYKKVKTFPSNKLFFGHH